MSASDKIKTVRGVTLHRDPAREACFTVVQLHKDLHDYDDMSDVSRRQRLHRHMHNEMQTLEIVAQGLADFPDAPWELRMQLARQCWDESRHSAILYRRLRAMGGRKGEFPVMNYEWGVTQLLDSHARAGWPFRTAPSRAGRWICCGSRSTCGARPVTTKPPR